MNFVENGGIPAQLRLVAGELTFPCRTKVRNAGNATGFGASRPPGPPCPTVPWHEKHFALRKTALPFSALPAGAGTCARRLAMNPPIPDPINMTTTMTKRILFIVVASPHRSDTARLV